MGILLSPTVITDQAHTPHAPKSRNNVSPLHNFLLFLERGGLVLFPPERPHFIMALLCEHTLHFLHFTASTFASGEPCVPVRVRVCAGGGPFLCWISAEPDPHRYTTRTPVCTVAAARERSTFPCRTIVPAWSSHANLPLTSSLGHSLGESVSPAVLAGFSRVGLGLKLSSGSSGLLQTGGAGARVHTNKGAGFPNHYSGKREGHRRQETSKRRYI